jgi:hypothetical protein
MNMIVLTKAQPVKDLLDKRSGIYSVRMDSLIREYGDGLMITNREYALSTILSLFKNTKASRP